MNRRTDGIAQKAREARRELGLSECGPVDVTKMLRSVQGITVIRKPLRGNISGLFVRGRRARVIVINSARSLGHQNFTVAHEYYHLRFEPELAGRVCTAEQFGSAPDNEALADDFAAAFLIPREALDEAVYRVRGSSRRPLGMADLIELEQFFGASHAAMRARLEELGYLTKAHSAELAEGVVRAARVLDFDTSLYEPTDGERILSPYPRLAKEALDKGLITIGKYRELMMEGRFFQQLFGEEGQGSNKQDEGVRG